MRDQFLEIDQFIFKGVEFDPEPFIQACNSQYFLFKGGASSDMKKQDSKGGSSSPLKGAKQGTTSKATTSKTKQADSRDSKGGAKGSSSGGMYGN